MSEAFRIGIAGLGTVGTGVVKILQQNGAMIAERAGKPIEIVTVSARGKKTAASIFPNINGPTSRRAWLMKSWMWLLSLWAARKARRERW
jgi:homoserine dehydrogenase